MSQQFFKRKRHNSTSSTEKYDHLHVSSDLNTNLTEIKKILGKSIDVKIVEFLEMPVRLIHSINEDNDVPF